jgi:hypothetical protein
VNGVHLDGCCLVQTCSGFHLVRCTRLQYVVKTRWAVYVNTRWVLVSRFPNRQVRGPARKRCIQAGARTRTISLQGPSFLLAAMSQPTRKRDKLARLFSRNSGQTTPKISREAPSAPSTSASVPTESAAGRTSRSLGKSSSHTLHIQANDVDTRKLESRRPEILASVRTVLELADSVLDGCPIWGPKAAVSTAAKGITVMQVRQAAAISTA